VFAENSQHVDALSVWAEAESGSASDRPVWLGACEEFHGSRPRPLPLLADVVLVSSALALTGVMSAALLAGPALVLLGLGTGLYRERSSLETQGVTWYVRTLLVPAILLAAVLWAVAPGHRDDVPAAVALGVGLLVLTRALAWLAVADARQRGLGLQPTLLVGTTDRVGDVWRRLATFRETGLRYAASYSPSAAATSPRARKEALRQIDDGHVAHVLIVSGGLYEAVFDEFLARGQANRVPCSLVPPLGELSRHRLGCHLADLPVVPLGSVGFDGRRLRGKRVFDVVLASIVLVASIPFAALVALAIWLEDRGPVFYRQPRVGRDGRPFTIWKFRSMIVGADQMQEEHWHANVGTGLLFKLKDDPRVTSVGAVLRRFSLDELPQLLNVLRGDMSLVGPRPLPVDADDFDEMASKRHAVLPGMTGAWQVEGANALTYDDMIRLDLAYIATWSVGLDLRILARTIPALVLRRSPY
jgi:exopolysaccharide biosynthesis polyprenyl glycosylphosphotransferase